MDILQFYSKSPDAYPGEGAGESITTDKDIYAPLAKIKGWRKLLSNFAVTPFPWKALTWNTVEHAYQAAKFESLNEDVFYSFSLDSDTELGKGDGAAAKKQNKVMKLTKAQQKEWDDKKAAVLQELWAAKFKHNPEARQALLSTGNAQLWHVIPRSHTKEHWTDLEALRQTLREQAAQTNAPTQEAEMETSSGKKVRTRGTKASKAQQQQQEEEETKVQSPPEQTVVEEQTQVPGPGGVSRSTPISELDTTPEGESEFARPALDEPEPKRSSIRLCPVCDYYLYLDTSEREQSTLRRICRNCGYKEEDEKGGLVMEMMVQEKSSEAYKIQLNEYTHRDPCLPHLRKNVHCANPNCPSNTGAQDPDVIYIKYDPVNMLYIYICNVDGCGKSWRTGR